MAAKKCANHPLDPAVTVCSSCRRGLCSECWQRNLNGSPCCELCLHHLTSTGTNLALAVAFLLVCSGVAALVWRWDAAHALRGSWVFWVSFAAVVCGVSIWLALRETAPAVMRVEVRPKDYPAPSPTAKVGHPYRSALRNASRFVASPVSGVWTATLLLGCMVVVSITVPGLLHRPRWIEAELVVAAWWAIWAVTLSVLLYRGWRLSDDHVLAPPRVPWDRSRKGSKSEALSDALSWGCDPIGCGDLAGCGETAFVLTLVAAILGAVWLMVELAVPALFFLAYFLVRTSLARVANDHHDCERHLGRALGWGLVWASLYAAPLALVIFVAHRLLAKG